MKLHPRLNLFCSVLNATLSIAVGLLSVTLSFLHSDTNLLYNVGMPDDPKSPVNDEANSEVFSAR
jgi:hypothetical protein